MKALIPMIVPGCVKALAWLALAGISASTARGELPGDLDPGFTLDPSLPRTSRVAAARHTQDGQLLAVLDTADGFRLVRLLANGSLDPGFKAASIPGFVPGRLTIQPDGRILTGSFPDPARPDRGRLQRLHPDGQPDDTFVLEETMSSIDALTPLPGGGLLLGAKFGPNTSFLPSLYLHRVTATGAIDEQFSLTGNFPTLSNFGHVFPQGDGTILLAGPTLSRLSAGGVREAAFPPAAVEGWIEAALQLPDGRLMLASRFEGEGGKAESRIFRLTAQGTLDPTYTPCTFEGEAHRLAALPDGRILVAGAIARVGGLNRLGLARLYSGGGVDAGFICQLAPKLEDPTDATDLRIDGLGVLEDGRAYVAGRFAAVNGNLVASPLVVLKTDEAVAAPPQIVGLPQKVSVVEGHPLAIEPRVLAGTPATYEWRRNGNVIPGQSMAELHQRNVQLSMAGSYELTATTPEGAAKANLIVEVLPGPSAPGSLDVRLDANDAIAALTTFPSKLLIAHGAAGRIYVAAKVDRYVVPPSSMLIALKADGTLDESFELVWDETALHLQRITAITALPDGRLLAGVQLGRTASSGPDRCAVLRIGLDGTVDRTFNNVGVVLGSARITALALDSEGRILIGRDLTTTLISRLLPTGANDPQFKAPTLGNDPGLGVWVDEIVPSPDGRIWVRGRFRTANGQTTGELVCLQPNGSPDPGFHSPLPPEMAVTSMVPAADGGILLGLPKAPGLVRLKADGQPDANFHAPAGLADSGVYRLAVDNEGRIIVMPGVVQADRFPDRQLVRLFPDGSPDTDFVLIPDLAGMHEIVAEPDGQMLVAGEFWDTSGTDRTRLARINGTDERRIAIRRNGAGQAVVRINSRSGRRYTVEQASGLETPVWVPTGEVTGTGLPVEWVGSGAGGFIRVRAD